MKYVLCVLSTHKAIAPYPYIWQHSASCDFENLCVARCRHDYGLRSSLAKEVKGQMSIVTVFYQTFRPIEGLHQW